MKIVKSVAASLVALGVAAAPITAQAAPARAATPVAESEELMGSSAILYIALIAAAAALAFFVLEDDNFDTDDLPASP